MGSSTTWGNHGARLAAYRRKVGVMRAASAPLRAKAWRPRTRRPSRASARQQDAAKANRQTRNGKETNALPEHQIGPHHRYGGRKVDEAADAGNAAELEVQPVEAVPAEGSEYHPPEDRQPELTAAWRFQAAPEHSHYGKRHG